jgi:putative transposase
MRRRRTAEEVARLLREADRDLANGLTVSDICRKVGIAETTYYRWRQQHDPEQVDSDRRCRELELEVDRLKRIVAELLLDKQMLQDIAKKSGEPGQQRAAADYLGREISEISSHAPSFLMDRGSGGSVFAG